MSCVVVEDSEKKIYSKSDVLSLKSGVVTICVAERERTKHRHSNNFSFVMWLTESHGRRHTHCLDIPWSLSCHCFHKHQNPLLFHSSTLSKSQQPVLRMLNFNIYRTGTELMQPVKLKMSTLCPSLKTGKWKKGNMTWWMIVVNFKLLLWKLISPNPPQRLCLSLLGSTVKVHGYHPDGSGLHRRAPFTPEMTRHVCAETS